MNLVKGMSNKGSVRTTTSGGPAPKGPIASSGSKVNKASSLVRGSSVKGGAYMKKSKRKSMKKSRKSRRN
jgi:hypothetical protein